MTKPELIQYLKDNNINLLFKTRKSSPIGLSFSERCKENIDLELVKTITYKEWTIKEYKQTGKLI